MDKKSRIKFVCYVVTIAMPVESISFYTLGKTVLAETANIETVVNTAAALKNALTSDGTQTIVIDANITFPSGTEIEMASNADVTLKANGAYTFASAVIVVAKNTVLHIEGNGLTFTNAKGASCVLSVPSP